MSEAVIAVASLTIGVVVGWIVGVWDAGKGAMMSFEEREKKYGSEEEMDAGIRDTVRWLRENGFHTTDSGDGVSKFTEQPGMAFVLPFPHVVMAVPVVAMVAEADRLWKLLVDAGIDVEKCEVVDDQKIPLITVEAMYVPSVSTAILTVSGVDDAMLNEARSK